MPDVGLGRGKERFRMRNTLHSIKHGLGHRVIVRGQAFDLLDVESGMASRRSTASAD
jgi:hypothetical protein